MKLSEFYPEYMSSCDSLRESTRVGYESAYRVHLQAAFGDVELLDITVQRVETWAARYADHPGACRKAWAVLRQMLRKAAKWGVIPYDPCSAGVTLPRKKAYTPPTITAKETKTLLQGMWGHALEAMMIVATVCGLRRGEACGLQWEDIDLRRGVVHIRRSVQYMAGHIVVEEPKTLLSKRDIPLPRFAVTRLRQLKGKGRLIGDLTPLQVARKIKTWCRQHNLPTIPLSNLRTSWATNALEAGVDLKLVSGILGHTSIETTARYYLVPHVEAYKEAQRKYERFLLAS